MNKIEALKALGLGEAAQWDEIRARYRELALASHPDRHPGDADAADRFRRITEAYELLGRVFPRPPRRRRKGEVPEAEALDDIFAEIFEWERRRVVLRGEDVEIAVAIELARAVRRGDVKVRVPTEEACPSCHGRGAAAGSRILMCRFCFGRGVVTVGHAGSREAEAVRPCKRCHGRGTVPHSKCPACGGEGRIQGLKAKRISIPAGCQGGEILRFPGEGRMGWHGGEAGNLKVRIALRQPLWVRLVRWLRSAWVPLIVILMTLGCAGRQVRRYSSEVTGDMRSSYHRAIAAYNARRLEEAQNQFQEFISAYPYNKLTDEALFRLGEIHFGREDYSNALWYYREANSRVYSAGLGPLVSFREAMALHRLGRTTKAILALEKIPRHALRGALGVRVASFWVKLARDEGDSPILPYLVLYHVYKTWEGRGSPPVAPWLIPESDAERWLNDWVDVPLEGVGKIRRLEKRFKGTPAVVYPRMKLSLHWLDEGNLKKAKPLLSSVVEDFPLHPFAERARSLLAKAGADVTLKRYKVGVLLPLSGEASVYGEAVLHGIECAVGLRAPCEGVGRLTLVVEDSGENGESAAGAAKKLIGQGVSAILGPLLSATIDGAVAEAEAAKVPLIAIVKREGVAGAGDYIFQNFLTPHAQTREVVQWLAREGIHRYAILYPRTEVGQIFARAYEEEVQNLKGTIVLSLAYEDDDPNPIDILERMSKVKPSPEVVFIPDSYRKAGQIAAMIVEGGFETVRFAGTASWNHPELALKAGEYLQGAVFVDGFYADSKETSIQNFVTQFEAAYGSRPGMLEAYGYDSLLLVAKALQAAGTGRPTQVAQALNERLKARGLSGWMEVDQDGMVERELFLFKIQGGHIVEVGR